MAIACDGDGNNSVSDDNDVDGSESSDMRCAHIISFAITISCVFIRHCVDIYYVCACVHMCACACGKGIYTVEVGCVYM